MIETDSRKKVTIVKKVSLEAYQRSFDSPLKPSSKNNDAWPTPHPLSTYYKIHIKYMHSFQRVCLKSVWSDDVLGDIVH